MPIYEYRCLKCNSEFEQLQKFTDAPVSHCPHCGGQVKKLMSHSSFQLKGSGWYLTDYARKNTPQDTSGERHESKVEAKASEASGSDTPSSKPDKD